MSPGAGIELDRPLVSLDLETTGIRPETDRVIEIGCVKLLPDGARTSWRTFVNPGRPIPPEAMAIHHITDADVAGAPPFVEVAAALADFCAGSDLTGYNLTRFDLPCLAYEFGRLGRRFPAPGTRVVDACTIFHQLHPRDLAAAVRLFCGREHVDAHRAEADASATLDVLLGQLARHADLPRDVAALHARFEDEKLAGLLSSARLDIAGKLAWKDGEAVLTFTKKKGATLRQLVRADPGLLDWVLRSDFPEDLKAIVREALAGRFPEP